jgi:hypothetical protein
MFQRRIEFFFMSKPRPAPPLTTEEWDALRRLDACTLANAIQVCRAPEFSLEKLREAVRENQI